MAEHSAGTCANPARPRGERTAQTHLTRATQAQLSFAPPPNSGYFRSARMIATRPTTAAIPSTTGARRFNTDCPA